MRTARDARVVRDQGRLISTRPTIMMLAHSPQSCPMKMVALDMTCEQSAGQSSRWAATGPGHAAPFSAINSAIPLRRHRLRMIDPAARRTGMAVRQMATIVTAIA
jgi:hypothetical protein